MDAINTCIEQIVFTTSEDKGNTVYWINTGLKPPRYKESYDKILSRKVYECFYVSCQKYREGKHIWVEVSLHASK